MKFTYGYWVNKPGVENADAVQIREVKVRPDSVYLYAVPYAQDVRAMGGPVLEMTISSPSRTSCAPRPTTLWAAPKRSLSSSWTRKPAPGCHRV